MRLTSTVVIALVTLSTTFVIASGVFGEEAAKKRGPNANDPPAVELSDAEITSRFRQIWFRIGVFLHNGRVGRLMVSPPDSGPFEKFVSHLDVADFVRIPTNC